MSDMKNRGFGARLGFAIAGLRTGWQREHSFRTHVVFAGGAGGALVLLRPAPIWWAAVAIVAALVMLLELLNSAVEGLCDLVHPDRHPEIKAIKDMLAGAVLLASMTAVLVAAALLVDRQDTLRTLIGLGQ